MNRITVYYEQRVVGTIEVTRDGPVFDYDPKWIALRGAFPLSLQMPLSPRRVPSSIFLPWAANLLPEAENLRAIGLHLGAAPDDVIAILSRIGRDTAGAFSIDQPGTPGTTGWKVIARDTDLERIINELPSKPFMVGEDGVSMSLAGVQSKMGVARNSKGQLCIPLNGTPSTHILKPDSANLFGSVQNEAFCLTLAEVCRLPVAQVTTGIAGDRTYLLVTRYDRIKQQDKWRRLHQEDFCQAMGKPPSAKYESNQSGQQGPTLADMFALTRQAMGAADVIKLLDHVAFNILVCNTDAHAKNYSLMISGRGTTLAPIYDVMCASVWPNVTRNLAHRIAGKNRGEHLKRRHWQRFARDCSLNAPRLLIRIEQLAHAVINNAEATADTVRNMPAGDHPILKQCVTEVTARAHAIVHGLSDIDRRPPGEKTDL
ncbi:MAG: type II toxin-antitoxin system HipA family toxin [Pseudomonadota bacterium]